MFVLQGMYNLHKQIEWVSESLNLRNLFTIPSSVTSFLRIVNPNYFKNNFAIYKKICYNIFRTKLSGLLRIRQAL